MNPPAQPLRPRGTTERVRHIVIVGGGRVGAAVARRLPEGWRVVVVDPDPAAETPVRQARPDAAFVVGDGSSRLTLARCGLVPSSVLVAATPSDDVNREAARLARLHFGVVERVVLTRETPAALGEGESPGDFLVPAEAVAGRVLNRVSVEASRAVDVGLGAGEIVQVTVLEGSPAAGRALRDFGARHWLVAAVYRDGALLVPHGDTRVQAGDRVLLVGDPADLQDIASYFRGGAPIFPSQYGDLLAWAGEGPPPRRILALGEALGVGPILPMPPGVRELVGAPPAELAAWLDEHQVGCVAVEAVHLPWYVRLGLVRSRLAGAMVSARRPFLVQRGGEAPVQRILACVRDPRQQREVVVVGLDLARLLGAELTTLHVGAPEAPESRAIAADIDRVARIYGVSVTHTTTPGNPVAVIRAAAEAHDLVVLGHRPEHNSPLAPDVSTHLLHHLPAAALFVPWSPAG